MMRTVTSKELGAELKRLFPQLIQWLPTDREYLVAEVELVRELAEHHHDSRYVPSLWECEEIAMAFVVDVRRGRLDSLENIAVDERKNYAIGECFGRLFDSVAGYHQANIFYAADGWHLLDMQTRRIWQARRGRDDIYFVRI